MKTFKEIVEQYYLIPSSISTINKIKELSKEEFPNKELIIKLKQDFFLKAIGYDYDNLLKSLLKNKVTFKYLNADIIQETILKVHDKIAENEYVKPLQTKKILNYFFIACKNNSIYTKNYITNKTFQFENVEEYLRIQSSGNHSSINLLGKLNQNEVQSTNKIDEEIEPHKKTIANNYDTILVYDQEKHDEQTELKLLEETIIDGIYNWIDNNFTPIESAIFKYYFKNNISYQQIADTTGFSVSYAWNVITKIKNKIQDHITNNVNDEFTYCLRYYQKLMELN